MSSSLPAVPVAQSPAPMLQVPDWPAPATVGALLSTRCGGVSQPPYASFNLASHVGDVPAAVAQNRALLARFLPAEPLWLEQVHGTTVVAADRIAALPPPQADASWARRPGRVCAVLSADCLPVLLCDRAGTVVAAAHAGWRGLASGVIEATVAAMAVPATELLVWLGPAIGPQHFEVGAEVRTAFVDQDAAAGAAFQAGAGEGKWLADLYQLARLRLQRLGVSASAISGGEACTFSEPARFFSYRREACCGRMAALIWLQTEAASS